RPGAAGPPHSGGVMDAICRGVDWWSCNTREAKLITGRTDPSEAARALLAGLRCGKVLVRLGVSGCLVAEAAEEVVHVPGVPVTIVDTTGAGDAHLGAFIAAWGAGKGVQAAARRANVVAALTVSRRGPATSPTAEETDRFRAELSEPN